MEPSPQFELSVVIPSYNSAEWLPSTLDALEIALDRADLRAEVVVVDDGSSDSTDAVLRSIAREYGYPLRVVSQRNSGRFLARVSGLREAASDWVMLLDSRILIHPDSLVHVVRTVANDPSALAWNGHAVTDPASPLVGQFWEVPTHVFWGGYLRRPTPVTLTPENFDGVPKGTTVFLVPRDVFLAASERHWPDANARLSNDDTKILRDIVDHQPVRLDPGFSVTYRPRTNVRAFVRHTYDRGTTLIDGFGGQRRWINALLVVLGLAPLIGILTLAVLVLIGAYQWAIVCLGFAVLVALVPAAIAARNRCSARGVLAYVVYLPVFVFPYWFGVLRGLWLHREVLGRRRPARSA